MVMYYSYNYVFVFYCFRSGDKNIFTADTGSKVEMNAKNVDFSTSLQVSSKIISIRQCMTGKSYLTKEIDKANFLNNLALIYILNFHLGVLYLFTIPSKLYCVHRKLNH